MTHLALPSFLAAAVQRSGCDFIVTGAGGWIGRATLSLLADALGPADFRRRVTGVAAAARPLRLMNRVDIDLVELDVLERIEPRPCLLLHFAFLGREKVAAMTLPDYVAGNEAIALRSR